jgi:hypothetical protein
MVGIRHTTTLYLSIDIGKLSIYLCIDIGENVTYMALGNY